MTGGNANKYFQYATEADKDALVAAAGSVFYFRLREDQEPQPIDQVIALANKFKVAGKEIKVIFCAAANSDWTKATALTYEGITVIIELGNERYSNQFGLTFDTYIAEYTPFINGIRTIYPDMLILVNLCPRPTGFPASKAQNQKADAWNMAAKAYLSQHPHFGISWHMYYNSNDYAGLALSPANVAWNPSAPAQIVVDFYDGLINSDYTVLPFDVFSYLNKNFYGYEWHMTEFGALPAADESLDGTGGCGDIKNTIAYSAIMFDYWQTLTGWFDSMCIQALENEVGMISPHKRFDSGTGNKKRMEFLAFQLFNEVGVADYYHSETFSKVGTFKQYFAGSQNVTPTFTCANGLQIKSVTYRYVGGQPYTSSGQAKWMGDGSVVVPDAQIQEGITMPSCGFGYVTVVVERKPKKKWFNFSIPFINSTSLKKAKIYEK